MLLEPVLLYLDQEDKNQVVVLCVLYLAQISTTICYSTKSVTIDHYLVATTDFIIKHKYIGPLNGKRVIKACCAKNVLNEVKCFQSAPNSREPVAVKMVLHVKNCYGQHPYILDSAMHY